MSVTNPFLKIAANLLAHQASKAQCHFDVVWKTNEVFVWRTSVGLVTKRTKDTESSSRHPVWLRATALVQYQDPTSGYCCCFLLVLLCCWYSVPLNQYQVRPALLTSTSQFTATEWANSQVRCLP